MSDKKYNVIVTDPNTGEIFMTLSNVTVKSQRFSVEKPEDKADIKVDVVITGLLEDEVIVSEC
jgi:hypothetical protein